jgi:anti-sigma factor RsiW
LPKPFPDEKRLIAYLLGRLPASEQKNIEERYFTDADLLNQLDAAEDDLIDAYVRGELPAHENQQFESHYLNSPKRLERVATAQALRIRAAAKEQPAMTAVLKAPTIKPTGAKLFRFTNLFENLGPKLVFATALLFILVAASWLWLQNRGLQSQLEQARK